MPPSYSGVSNKTSHNLVTEGIVSNIEDRAMKCYRPISNKTLTFASLFINMAYIMSS